MPCLLFAPIAVCSFLRFSEIEVQIRVFKMIDPVLNELFARFKSLVKENSRLQAEYRSHVADLKRLFRKCRSQLPKKPKSN